MMCSEAKELIAASWNGELDEISRARLLGHTGQCEECAQELSQLSAMWESLGGVTAPEPSQALHVRWHSTLESLTGTRRAPSWGSRLRALWPQRPRRIWQPAIAAGC